MTPVGTGAAKLYSSQSVKTQASSTPEASAAAPLKVEQNKVTLSDEGKALLAALQELEKDNKVDQNKEKTVGDKVESFAHGALGLDHPDKIPEEEDDSYSAGQYLSAAATVGGLLLLL